ncbi:MAG: biopolymer transporter ExbD, partial [Hyphomonadaceae bacterium]
MAGGLAASSRRGGRGRRSARRGRLSEINVTPFVDVMLVLLIVFMVTAPLLTVSIPIELPRTEAKQSPSETEPLSITIRADGVVFLQETQVDVEELVP